MQLLKPRVYADAAAATPLSPRARRQLVRLLSIYGNAGALHREALAAKRELESARERVADALSAHMDEIIFTSGGTEGNNMALGGSISALVGEFGPVHAITLAIEHPSVLEPLRAMALEGHIELTELSVEEDGRLSLEALKDAIRPNTALISIQLINSEIGTIQDIREVMKLVRHEKRSRTSRAAELPIYVHTDASQAPLWLPLNVEKLGVDLITLDGQKIMGPKGVGALYVRRGTVLQPVVFGGGQEKGLRSGTENVPLIGSFAVAFEDAQKGVEARAARIADVRDFLMREIAQNIPNATFHGVMGEWRAANNCSLSIPGLLGDMAVLALDAEGVAASTRSACGSDTEAPSHVIMALGRGAQTAREAVRLTLLPSATMRDASLIAHALKKVVQRYARVIE
jgi:cysteine desulfurase